MDGIAIKAMVSELAPVMREYVEAATGPLLERIAVLESEKGALATRCEALEEAATKAPEIDLMGVQKLIEAEIAKLPEPVDTAELLEPLNAKIAELEAREPVAGPPGEKGDAGSPGEPGRDGADGKNGQDGRGVKDLLIDRDGNLIATLDDGQTKSLGPVCGKDGAPGQNGKDGRDGIELDSFEAIVLDDDRTIELKFASGQTERVASFKWPTIIDRGVYKAGETYSPGDAVTWGGSLWIAQKETDAKPDTADSGFRLAVKRGRDGKDVKVG